MAAQATVRRAVIDGEQRVIVETPDWKDTFTEPEGREIYQQLSQIFAHPEPSDIGEFMPWTGESYVHQLAAMFTRTARELDTHLPATIEALEATQQDASSLRALHRNLRPFLPRELS
jgi:hypothetical protein